MNITSTSERGVTVQGQFKIWSDIEDREITVNSKTVSWDTLRAASKQEDKDLAAVYSDILTRAEKMEETRLIAEDRKRYGYPLRTGFGQQYSGQIVSRAWEIRRVQDGKKDVRVAYILTYDRSDRSITRTPSPEFADYDECLDWLSHNYGGWHEELGERTAEVWLRD